MDLDELYEKIESTACSDGIMWLRSRIDAGDTWDQAMAAMPPEWYLWAARYHEETERMDSCAARNPEAALRYAAALLTPERLDWCAKWDPWAALEYAAALLTPERLDWCAEQELWAALHYAAARRRS